DASSTSRSVDVYMARLREKTSSCTGFEIVTVHGLGYKAVLK
ncbi:MAG: winged helix-turn-helix domain-containing protein, partial [Candidatus Gallimonas sp.]